ncbi:MAG: trypsin-like peptidase domain-containing protein [Ruminococcus sp.]|uniref:S1C family serine protease n=1 Tax=Ruminococcus sp. TaxID=41978 RepID=UPI0025D09652|nr:trypsin-like peptidase domain-containing protein [Ruminococcus sp.]MBR5684244.1 trypsin-like peptidase domain-containing protein [Ruminococcus sp.]
MNEYNYNFNNNENQQNNGEGYNGFSTDGQQPQEQKPRKKHSFLKVAAFVVAMGVVSAGSIEGYRIFNRESNIRSAAVVDAEDGKKTEKATTATKEAKSESVTAQNVSIIKPEEVGGSTLSTEDIVEKMLPSVVGIESTFTTEVRQSMNDFFDFGFGGGFDFGFGNGNNDGGTTSKEYKGTGTGVIISENGYIVTNAHVIYDSENGGEQADSVSVLLNNDEAFEAEIVGYDVDYDLAVLKIDETDLTAAEFGNSDELMLGESVIAIGNPLGFDLMDTVTGGMISGLGRHITINDKTMNLIQTDAAINSGNSGGPLINKYGQVIGINSSKMSSSYGSSEASIEGIGFAIPSNLTANVIDDLMKYGYVTGKPQLGISCYDVTETAAKMYNLPVGIFVSDVKKGSGAEKAGLQNGDIIVALNGKKVKSYEELSAEKNIYSAGDEVEVTFIRNGDEKTVKLILDEVDKPQADEENEEKTSKKSKKSASDNENAEEDNGGEEEAPARKNRNNAEAPDIAE